MKPDELIGRARGLVPVLRERAQACEDRRSLPPPTVADFRAAGFLRTLQPARFGGHELWLDTLLDLAREIGRGCGSSAWCLAIFALHGRIVALFEQAAQEEVYGVDGDAVVAGVLDPTGTAVAARCAGETGLRVRGRWRFASGCEHAGWIVLAARVARDREGPVPDVRCVLVPARSVRIEDTWRAAGLRGTGSHDVVLEDVFVPARRTVSFLDLARGAAPGTGVNPSSLYRLPLVPVLALVMVGPALGLGEATVEVCAEASRAKSPVVRSRGLPDPADFRVAVTLGEAIVELETVGALVRRDLAELARWDRAQGFIERGTRVRYRLHGAFAVDRCRHLVGRLLAASGTRALFDTSPVQRAFRDLHAMAAHAALRLDSAAEELGRQELGLPPTSAVI
jgi:3-hydroxy-9,10-secoandrosta-1,3,5(10)-triene-9,17-dione monooxygenase